MNNLFEFDRNILSHSKQSEESQKDASAAAQHDIILIGTDEAGRGPGAGGVFASAVCFVNPDVKLIKELSDLNDSKKLSKKKREELYEIILGNTINSTVCIEVEEIEKINILNASLKAMKLACENVIKKTGNIDQKTEILILVDGNKPIKLDSAHCSPSNVYPIVKGDSKSASIAAASILAKVSRDRYMEELHEKFPKYNWVQNAGYLTAEHLAAIQKYGITPHHRKSFLSKQKIKQLSLLN